MDPTMPELAAALDWIATQRGWWVAVDRCTVCDVPTHATESDDDGRCVACMRAAGVEPVAEAG